MTSILDELQSDHANLSAVLTVLDHQLERLRAGQDPDYELMEAVLDYCVSYGNQWHHPTEDLVYAELEARGGTVSDLSRGLHDEHRSLAELTGTFHEMVEDVLGGGLMPRAKLLQVADQFLRDYRSHMDFEERFLFPTARNALSAEAWAKVGDRSERISDPLFGDEVAARFRALREYIHGLERASVPPTG